MNRPYIFCHMMTSLDGRIMGPYMETAEGEAAGDAFYQIAFGKEPHYHHQGWLSGRVTTDDNFTHYKQPQLDPNAPPVPEGDFIAQPNAGMYYVSVDPSGKLGWESSTLTYVDTTAHVIEVLTDRADNAYKAFLRKLGISYIIAGDRDLDYALALSKLKELFHIETLMLGGGGILNWCDHGSGRRVPGHSGPVPGAGGLVRQSGRWVLTAGGQGTGGRRCLAPLFDEGNTYT